MVHKDVGSNPADPTSLLAKDNVHAGRGCRDSVANGPTRWCPLLVRKGVRLGVTLVGDVSSKKLNTTRYTAD